MTTSWSVGELSMRLAETLAGAFPDDVWVTGEIRDLSRSAAGHVYFQLVEPAAPQPPGGASLAVVLFDANRRGVNAMLRRTGSVRMTDGVQVRIRAEVVYYPPQSRIQLRMVGIDPFHTLGALEADRDRVLRKLATEGLLERNGRQPFPRVPHTIGLVTSVGSAAHADFLEELAGSGLSWRVRVVDARVQGRQAERSIVAAITALAQRDVDVIAVVRGGGARTDLAAFDNEAIARTIASCAKPVVTGIGHEVDTSVADAVATTSYKTPTACAAGLVALGHEAARHADATWGAIAAHATDHLVSHSDGLRRAATTVTSLSHHHLRADGREIDRFARTVHLRAPLVLDNARRDVGALAARADALDPARALARGWSITHTDDGQLVRRVDHAPPGTHLVTTVADGEVHSVTGGPGRRGPKGAPDG